MFAVQKWRREATSALLSLSSQLFSGEFCYESQMGHFFFGRDRPRKVFVLCQKTTCSNTNKSMNMCRQFHPHRRKHEKEIAAYSDLWKTSYSFRTRGVLNLLRNQRRSARQVLKGIVSPADVHLSRQWITVNRGRLRPPCPSTWQEH